MKQLEKDEIWLKHLTAHHQEWIAFIGPYPHEIVGHGKDAVEAVNAAKANGHDDAVLFFVPPPMPLCPTAMLHL